MINRIILSGLLSLVTLSTVNAETKVFLLGGQSNMEGAGGYTGIETGRGAFPADAACPALYASQPDVQFWSNGWTGLRVGFGNPNWPSRSFGPELSFGYTLHNSIFPDDDIYLVKVATSSMALAPAAHQWTPDGTGWIYNSFAAQAHAAINDLATHGKSPVVAGMIWMQGESDSTAAYAPLYEANLTNFIGKVRSEFGALDMPFVLGRIDDYPWASDSETVREAQMSVAASVPNTTCFNTDDLERAYWGHYGTQGQIDLGIRFAEAFAAPEPGSIILLAIAAGIVAAFIRARRPY
jgi:hypothetical protein